MQKVLIITYYWPPAGGPGVQRWLNFVKFLPENQIAPIVFIPDNPNYALMDHSLTEEVPENITILKQPIKEPYKFASLLGKSSTKKISTGVIPDNKKQSLIDRLLLFIRGNFFIPDARKSWIKPSVQRLEKYIAQNSIKTIITTGPPHSVHLIGLKLKNAVGIRWIADFRDPWTSIGYHKKLKLTKYAQQKHKRLEKAVLNDADCIITTSKATQDEFANLTSKPIHVITNGFLPTDENYELSDRFTVSHIGSLLTDRNPEILWEVLSELSKENEAFEKALHLQFVGVLSDGVKNALKEFDLWSYVDVVGYVPHNQVYKFQKSAQVLLLLEINSEETQAIIPGKLFEYFKAQRPILALGPTNWEAGTMVKEHKAGAYFTKDEKEALKALVLQWFELYKSNQLKTSISGIEQYHRSALTKKLVELL